ncbi:CRACD-like protein isoform X2 [Ascaphus truei]|uniref:CRACD-like protein isoform X2 n=1 Tax=Ascaphus truei TaxID=8439 RepID=UPI003F5A5CBF
MDSKLREVENLADDSSAKKKSKFKSFKKFFGIKKRKETLPSLGQSGLTQSQSASDITVPDSMRMDYDSEDEIGSSGSVLGSRAVSHDSIFIPEVVQETVRPIRVFSQENVSDRIKALQLKIQTNIRSGPSPFGFYTKRIDDAGTSSEDDGLPRSPPEMSLLHEAIKSRIETRFSDPYKHLSSLSLAGTGSEEDEQISSGHSSRPLSPEENLTNTWRTSPHRAGSSSISPTAGFDIPARFSTVLDNSAAKHRLSVKPKNQRSSKNRRPSAVLHLESHADLTFTEEEDESDMNEEVTTSAKEHGDQKAAGTMTAGISDSLEAQAPDLSNLLSHSLGKKENELCSEITMVKELEATVEETYFRSPELECSDTLTLQFEDTTSDPDIKLDGETKVPNTLVEDSNEKINESGANSLCAIEKHLLYSELSSKKGDCPLPYVSTPEKSIVKDDRIAVEPVQSKRKEKTSFFPDLGKSMSESVSLGHSHGSPHGPSRSDKSRSTPEQPLSDKENNTLVGNTDKKVEKAAFELGMLRKFSVSSAWERPRTGSFSLKGNVEGETPKNIKLSLPKSSMSVSERVKDDPRPAAIRTENKGSVRKKETLPDSDCKSVDKADISCSAPAQSTVPAVSDLSAVSDLQTDPEDKSPFLVKLRSTSLSLRYRDGASPESSRVKRYSAEFKQDKVECFPFSEGELAEVRSTEINVLNSKMEKAKGAASVAELTPAKPQLPKKPVLQNITVTDNNTNKEASESVSNQEKKVKSSESRIEKKTSEKRPSLHKTIAEKSTPSSVTAGESVKGTESKVQPAWITLALQKQRGLKEEQPPTEEKLVYQEAEKQNKDKERTEVYLRQQVDLVQNKTTNSAAPIFPELHGQETKAELKEQRQRANTLSLPVSATSSSLLEEKDEKTPVKRASRSVTDQPSWMELAKKKSQAWSDMPQIIK